MKSPERFLLSCGVAAALMALFLYHYNRLHEPESKPEAPPAKAAVLWDKHPAACVEIEGHQYLIFRWNSGVSTLHSESCPCKTK